MGLLRGLRRFDSFRLIPDELTEATAHGGWFSIIAYMLMFGLLYWEANTFLTVNTHTDVVLDASTQQTLKIRFDVTMMDLPCKIASVDTVDYFGNEHMNITKDIDKISLHYIPSQDRYYEGGKNKDDDTVELQKLVKEEEEESARNKAEEDPSKRTTEIDAKGHHAYELGAGHFDSWLGHHDLTFVNFYAPWCSHCQRLHPTWEKSAIEIDKHLKKWKHNLRVKLVSVNCVKDQELCMRSGVQYFPYLILYKKDKVIEEYLQERTYEAITKFFIEKARDIDKLQSTPSNVVMDKGCRIKGALNVPRAPGNFHVQAFSHRHAIDAKNTNVSHIVDKFEFGVALAESFEARLPAKLRYNIRPLEDQMFLATKAHTAPQHYINVVPTNYNFGAIKSSTLTPFYQMTTQSRTAILSPDEVPKAKFSFHISPVNLVVTQDRQPLYAFLTNLCAIIGGTYTVVKIANDIFGGIKEAIGKDE